MAARGASVTEATTRTLEMPNDPFTPHAAAPPTTQNATRNQTRVMQNTAPMPSAPATQNIGKQPCRKSGLRRLAFIVIALLLLFSFAPVALWRIFSHRRVVIMKPPKVAIPAVPSAPAAPPAIPAPPASGDAADALIYPNAAILQKVVTDGDVKVLRLQSGDSFDSVLKWYEDKLKPEEKVLKPNDGNAVLKGDDATAVIRRAGDRTEIIITDIDN